MPISSATRICRSIFPPSSKAAMPCIPALRTHGRKISQHHRDGESSRLERPERRRNLFHPSKISSNDAIAHFQEIFPPLEFPADIAQRMTTHISWNRGVDGHNGRLSFVGRRVLQTYLLLFLHECSLPPRGYKYPKNASAPPSARLRHTTLVSGAPLGDLSDSYSDISERLLNTYVLGQYVGAAWNLERIMRWTPAIAELDTLQAESPDEVLHSSGLYKVRGTTVEGVMGGIFHQFGGAVAHRVFHTRLLLHIAHLGLPAVLRAGAEEACERFGGPGGLLLKPPSHPKKRVGEGNENPRNSQEVRENSLQDDAYLAG